MKESDKAKQKQLLIDMMKQDEEAGMYESPSKIDTSDRDFLWEYAKCGIYHNYAHNQDKIDQLMNRLNALLLYDSVVSEPVEKAKYSPEYHEVYYHARRLTLDEFRDYYSEIEKPEPVESQEDLWLEAQCDVKDALGTYSNDLICDLARWAIEALQKKYVITRKP